MKNNELDALFTGLTGTADNKQEVSSPKEQTTTKAKKSSAGKDRLRQKTLEQARNQQRFCSIIDSDVLKKIRIIVIEAAFIKAIDIYECKHGVIEDNTKRKAIDLF